MTYQPLNTCESKAFKDMCSSLNPKVKSIDRHTATSRIGEIAARVKASLEIDLKRQYFALTCDHWTSIAGTSYLAATVHYINDDWELVSFTLSCKEHTGTSKADDVLRVLKDAWVAYKLDTNHLVGVVTDTAPVMGAFGRKLPDNVPHLYCVDHVLELTTVSVRAFLCFILFLYAYTYDTYTLQYFKGLAFNVRGAQDLMARARGLVGHFSSSSQASESLANVQRRGQGSRPLGVMQDVRTRWWSTWKMIQRLRVLKHYFGILVDDRALDPDTNLTEAEWDTLLEIEEVLEPFMVV